MIYGKETYKERVGRIWSKSKKKSHTRPPGSQVHTTLMPVKRGYRWHIPYPSFFLEFVPMTWVSFRENHQGIKPQNKYLCHNLQLSEGLWQGTAGHLSAIHLHWCRAKGDVLHLQQQKIVLEKKNIFQQWKVKQVLGSLSFIHSFTHSLNNIYWAFTIS